MDNMTQMMVEDEWCEAGFVADGIMYYLDYEDGNAWYYINLASDQIGKLE